MINVELAYRMRYESGYALPDKAEYSNPRLKEIAIREQQLFDELDKLDKEIKEIYLKELDDKITSG